MLNYSTIDVKIQYFLKCKIYSKLCLSATIISKQNLKNRSEDTASKLNIFYNWPAGKKSHWGDTKIQKSPGIIGSNSVFLTVFPSLY